jgi:Cu(I)/Ag(I) efflux system membrane fusion protein
MGDGAAPPKDLPRRNLRWWLRVIEVRLRFVVLVLVVLAVATQWQRLRGAWDDWWYAWSSAPTPSGVSGEIEYFCPMDPGVVSIWPAICPICNMDLVQRKKHDAQLLPEGVVARMQISPYRVQLAGIQTTEVASRKLIHEIPVAGVLNASLKGPDTESSDDGLTLVAAVSRRDAPLLTEPRAATVSAVHRPGASFDAVAEIVPPTGREAADSAQSPDVPHVRVRVTSEHDLAPGTPVRAVIRVPAADLAARSQPGSTGDQSTDHACLAVPETAVVDHGERQLVFVESMPGTFDAVVVRLGPRCGDYYPVLSGLEPKQRVAVAGAFLIDAETRLNPSLAVAYFGANQASAERRMPQVSVASADGAAKGPALTPEELALAEQQKVCPVTDLPLNSMGGPVVSVVEGRKVFLCCKGCEPRLQANPAKYLAKLSAP